MKVERWRKKIDKIDNEIVRLIARRKEYAKRIGKEKRKKKMPIRDTKREKKVLAKVRTAAKKHGIDEGKVERLFAHLIEVSRRAQEGITSVAFLGPKGTFSEEAAMKFFGKKNMLFLPCKTIKRVFKAVERGKADFGVVPVENTTEGSVGATLDLLFRSNLLVYGEMEIKIHHYLASEDNVKGNVIFSHPQALAQCRETLESKFPDAEFIDVSSTAKAMELAKKRKGMAVGSALAVLTYRMKVVERNIEDNPNNYTRFFVLSMSDRPGRADSKTSVIFSARNRPGALYNALSVFAKRKINLTKIESRPTKQKQWEYVFYIDFEGDRKEKKIISALEELEKKCDFIKILGSYPRAR